MIRVGIIGRGYTATETVRWLGRHPEARAAVFMARVDAPEPAHLQFPSLPRVAGGGGPMVEPVDVGALAGRVDAVILSLPHTTSQQFAPALIDAGIKVIDLSADFRFDSVPSFEKTYGVTHLAPELNARIPYSLPELFGGDIAGAPGLACPGCYPTATLLALAPVVSAADGFNLDHIVVDAMSGASGAGRKLEIPYLFCELNESVSAYGVGKHRHRPEIEEKLTRLAGRDIRITFTPHLMPMERGILATVTVPLTADTDTASVRRRYEEFYAGRPFVRVLGEGETCRTASVADSNFCDLQVTVDDHSRVLIIQSAIDNLGKGAVTQGIQAMNLLFGLPETRGLLPDPG